MNGPCYDHLSTHHLVSLHFHFPLQVCTVHPLRRHACPPQPLSLLVYCGSACPTLWSASFLPLMPTKSRVTARFSRATTHSSGAYLSGTTGRRDDVPCKEKEVRWRLTRCTLAMQLTGSRQCPELHRISSPPWDIRHLTLPSLLC